MASLSGSFTGPAVSDSVAFSDGPIGVWMELSGEWFRAIIVPEISRDDGASWSAYDSGYGIHGVSRSDPYRGTTPIPPGLPPHGCIEQQLTPAGSGLMRLRCVEFRSGWCTWNLST